MRKAAFQCCKDILSCHKRYPFTVRKDAFQASDACILLHNIDLTGLSRLISCLLWMHTSAAVICLLTVLFSEYCRYEALL